MGNFFSRVIGASSETQQEPLLQTQTEASFSSPTDIHPPALGYFDSQLNFPTENAWSGRTQLYSLSNLPLQNNFLSPIFYGFWSPEYYSDLQALAEDIGEQSEFFVVTSEHPDFSDIFLANNQVRALLLPTFDEELNQASIDDELLVGIRWFNVEFEVRGSLIFKFELCRIDDGAISDSVMRQIVLEELMQTEYFDNFEDRMWWEGNIRFFVCTRNQLRNPQVVIFLQEICINHINMPVYLYDAESLGISYEEAAEILGSPMCWIEGLEETEIDCVICLDLIERGDQVKALACKHVYHYACILRSTKRRQQCPLCCASYDYRQAQSE